MKTISKKEAKNLRLKKNHAIYEIIKDEAYIHLLDIKSIGNTERNIRLWKKLLTNWVKVMKEYMTVCQKEIDTTDVPYWHCEDANTSFLAAAAWKSGAIAIEQFDVNRKYKQKRRLSKGHCDLWVKFKDKDGFDFTAEAKRSQYLKPKDIEKKLKEATRNLRSLANESDRGQFQVSLCFVILEPKKKPLSKKISLQSASQLFKGEHRKNLIVTTYFPNKNAEFLSYECDKKPIYCPGVVLIARISKEHNT